MRGPRAALAVVLMAAAGIAGPWLPGLAAGIGAYLWLGVLPGLAVAAWAGGALRGSERWTLGLALSPLLSATLGAYAASHGVPIADGARWIGGIGAVAALAGAVRPGSRSGATSEPPSAALRWWPVLAAALVALPPLLNSWIRIRSDAWVHASIVWEILERGVPPQDPRFAGLTLNYVWIFNFFIAQLTALGGGDPFTLMSVFNVAIMATFLRVVWHLGERVWGGREAADGALLLAAVGFNAGAWLLWPLRLIRVLGGYEHGPEEIRRQLSTHFLGTVDVVFSLSAPFALMSSMIDKFVLGTALGYAWVLLTLFLWALAWWFEERDSGAWAWAAAAAAGLLFVHGVVGLSALPVAGATLAVALLLRARLPWLPGPGRLAAFGAAIALGIGLAAPYTWAISRGWAAGESGLEHSYFGVGFVMPWTLITSCGVALWLARRPIAEAFRGHRAAAALIALFAAGMIVFSLVIQLPTLNHNKFPFQCFLPLAVLGGRALLPAARALLARRGPALGGALLAALFAVPPALTIGSYIADRGPHDYPILDGTPGERALEEWVRSETPRHAVFLDDGFRDSLPVGGRRRLYLGTPFGPDKAAYPRDRLLERRAVMADVYGPGTALEGDARALRGLDAPAYVLYRPGAAHPAPVAGRPDLFEPVYDHEGYVVYRVAQP